MNKKGRIEQGYTDINHTNLGLLLDDQHCRPLRSEYSPFGRTTHATVIPLKWKLHSAASVVTPLSR
jgi:hypothetical protein